MSNVNDRSLEPVYLTTTSQTTVPFSVASYSTLSLSFAGTITTGTFTVEASTDGVEWEELPVAKSNNQLANNEIGEVGTFIIGVAGYALARIVPDSFTGNVKISPNISTRYTPAFTVGFG